LSGTSWSDWDAFADLRAEYPQFFPAWDRPPAIGPEQVARFVAAGERGRELARAGDRDGAEAAFGVQIDIFPLNPEPWISRALLAAERGERKLALESMRAAVLRGFTDLRAVERAEAWVGLRRHGEFLRLQDAVPVLLQYERRWPGWDAFRGRRAPSSVQIVLDKRARAQKLLDGMQPVLGERQVRLWARMLDRASAALLETYLAEGPEAADRAEALEHLMALYTGGADLGWEVLEPKAAMRLGKVADLALGRSETGATRAGALVCRALARNGDRDRRGRLTVAAAEDIRGALGDVLAEAPDSPFVPLAVEGIVRTEIEAGRESAASEVYARFLARHADDPGAVGEAHERLGELALRAGGLPAFRTETLDGSNLERDTLRGKVTVIDFWATWCGPCVDEIPTLRRIAERHGDEVLLLGVNLDERELMTEEALRSWIRDRAMPGVHVADGAGWESDLVRAFGVREIPFTVVADPTGRVLAVGRRGKDLLKAVRAALDD